MRNTRVDAYEYIPRNVIATANHYSHRAISSRHAHRRGQLLYAAAGVITTITGDGGWVVPPQRALWIPPGVAHETLMNGQVSTLSAYVTPKAAASMGLPLRCRVIGVSPLLHALLLEAVDLPPRHALNGRDGRVMRLLLDEIRRMPVLPLSTPLPSERRLAALCRALLDDPSLKANIDRMAKRAGMSRRHFTRLFREQTGMSFGAWRQQACLLSAMMRIGRGEPITRVAFDLGYASPSAFTAAFRRTLGAPPKRYLGTSSP